MKSKLLIKKPLHIFKSPAVDPRKARGEDQIVFPTNLDFPLKGIDDQRSTVIPFKSGLVSTPCGRSQAAAEAYIFSAAAAAALAFVFLLKGSIKAY